MGEISDPDIPEVLHIELRSAVDDLAKSVKVAATHIKLRAKCSAAIEDAAKAEKIAAIFRAAAISSNAATDQPEVSLAPEAQSNCIGELITLDAMDAIYSACTWLSDAQSLPRKAKPSRREESKIAKRIVEVQERLRDQGKDIH
jgi:hypothetical protein